MCLVFSDAGPAREHLFVVFGPDGLGTRDNSCFQIRIATSVTGAREIVDRSGKSRRTGGFSVTSFRRRGNAEPVGFTDPAGPKQFSDRVSFFSFRQSRVFPSTSAFHNFSKDKIIVHIYTRSITFFLLRFD
jgi:hypothetical protein